MVLGAVGSAIGGAFGGTILGFSGAAISGFIGSATGSVVDNWIVSSLAPAQRIEGARLDSLRITSSTEGAVIPRLFGRMRIGGNIIWATDFREEVNTTSQGGGNPPGIFVLDDGMGLVAKRLEHIPNSDPPAVRVISYNKLYPEYERTAEEIASSAASAGSRGRYENGPSHSSPRAHGLSPDKNSKKISLGAQLCDD